MRSSTVLGKPIDPDAALDLTGDELVDEWRGVNLEDVDEVTGGLAGLLRSRSRALLSDLIRPHHRALVLSSVMVPVLLSLLVVPVVYTFLDDFRPSAIFGWLRRAKPAGEHDAVPATSPVTNRVSAG